MRIDSLLLSLVLLTPSAAPQQGVSPATSPPADNSSIEVTMKFIQDKLNAVGKVNYTLHWHDNADDTYGIVQINLEESNVVAEPASCWIKYHLKIVNGTTFDERDNGFFLSDVQDLVVARGEQEANKHYTASGYPTVDSKIDPPIFWLVARRVEKENQLSVAQTAGEDAFVFTNEEMADRVAKAMLHAVKLCGGGHQETKSF